MPDIVPAAVMATPNWWALYVAFTAAPSAPFVTRSGAQEPTEQTTILDVIPHVELENATGGGTKPTDIDIVTEADF